MKLIDKSALVAEIDRMKDEYLKHCKNKFHAEWSCGTLDNILYFLNTLEVKEVDLKKEIKEEYLRCRWYGGKNNMFVILNEPQFNKFAKHFFELGLKVAQKGEEV